MFILNKFYIGVVMMSLPIIVHGLESQSMERVFYDKEYAGQHWAMKQTTPESINFIAKATYKNSEYAIYLNPSDSRGYRSIVTLTDSIDPSTTFNRDYTLEESIGLNLLITLVTQVYSKIDLVSQSSVAGNNSHSFDPNTGIFQIGNSKEPSMLHGHVYGRGNPNGEYIEGVKLGGPAPGEIFDMRGATPNVPGNESKTKWNAGEMEKVTERLKAEIEKIKYVFEGLGLTIATE